VAIHVHHRLGAHRARRERARPHAARPVLRGCPAGGGLRARTGHGYGARFGQRHRSASPGTADGTFSP
jgi:hypothetical protein